MRVPSDETRCAPRVNIDRLTWEFYNPVLVPVMLQAHEAEFLATLNKLFTRLV